MKHQYGFYLHPTENSPVVIIDFPTLLFEARGNFLVEKPDAFYAPIFQYIYSNFYQIKNSIYFRDIPTLTLHLYIRKINAANYMKIKELDQIFFSIKEFKTYIYWYHNPTNLLSKRQAEHAFEHFNNSVRLITNTNF